MLFVALFALNPWVASFLLEVTDGDLADKSFFFKLLSGEFTFDEGFFSILIVFLVLLEGYLIPNAVLR